MLRIAFYTIIVVLILSFFGISLQSIVNSPVGQANFAYLWSICLSAWAFIVNSFGSVVSWFSNLIPYHSTH